MPPKSANRSGKSTPTKGQSKDKDKKKDEEEIRQQEEEEARKKAEEEEKARLEKEQKAREEIARLEKLELSRREQHLAEVEDLLRKIKNQINLSSNDRRASAVWERYMRCDGSPDPTILPEISTYINLMKEAANDDITVVLEESKDIHALIFELKFLLEDTPEEDLPPETQKQYKETIITLQDLLMQRYNAAVFKILKEAIYEADSESGNLQKVIKGAQESILLWGNLNKNPRFKSYAFEDEQKFTFELPKPLAMADIGIRNLKMKYDPYSHQCSTFYPKAKKVKEEVIPEEVKVEEGREEETAKDGEEKKSEEEEDSKSVTTDGRKSALSVTAGSTKEGEEKEGEGEVKGEEEGCTPALELPPEEEEELDDILDEDVVDLRQYQLLGGVFHLDLVKLPPQPKSARGWTLRQVIDEPLTKVEYPSEAFAPKATSRAASAKEEPRDTDSPSKNPVITEQTQPPLSVSFKLPTDVMFFEEPQVGIWDPIDSHWKTNGITDINYHEETKSLSFKTRHFGTFCLLQDSHVNMPFQQWEMRPLGPDHVLLTISAAIAEAIIEIKGKKCRIQAPEDEEAQSSELAHLYEEWMTCRELMEALRSAGVNIFPAEDSEKFVSIQEKAVDLEVLYDQMGLMASAFAFSWSKWNSTAGKDKVVVQAAPWLGHGDTRKKNTPIPATYTPPPPNLSEDDWGLFLFDGKRAYKLGITEYDDDLVTKVADGCEFYSDFYHALRETPYAEDGKSNLPPREKVLERLRGVDVEFVNTVQIFLKATKCITYS